MRVSRWMLGLCLGLAAAVASVAAQAAEPARPTLLQQLESETAELFASVHGSIVWVQLPRGVADPASPLRDQADTRPDAALGGGPPPPRTGPLTPPTVHATVVAPSDPLDPSATPATRPIEVPARPGEPPEPLAQAMGVQIDPHGHVLLPIYLHASSGAAALRAWSLQGRQTTATIVGSDRQSGVTIVKLAEPIATPLATASGGRPVSGSLVLLVPSAMESPRLVLWSRHAEDKGLVIDLDRRVRGFARLGQFVSIEGSRSVIDQLVARGRVDRPKLGVWIIEQRLGGEQRPEATPAGPIALQVQLVVEGTPAAQAGVLAGDVVVGLDGQEVDDLASFAAAIAGVRGKTTLRVIRDGRAIELPVSLD